MMQYSLADRRPEETVLSYLKEHNKGVLIRGALAQGLLLGKPAKEYLGHTAEEINKAAQAVQTCVTDNRTSTQTAVRFVLQHPAVTSAIVGVSKMEQLNDMAATTNSTNLLENEINILRESISAKKYQDHR